MNAIRAIVFALAMVPAASAPVAAASCPGLAVAVEPGADARWPALSEQIRREFAGRSDVDPCARVAVTMRGSSPLVTVTLPDGRLAGRAVGHPDEVIPVLAALLLVPEAPVATASAATPAMAPAPETPGQDPRFRRPPPRPPSIALTLSSRGRAPPRVPALSPPAPCASICPWPWEPESGTARRGWASG